MPLVGFRLGKDEVPFTEALELARKGQIPYPPAFLRAIFSDRVDPVPSASSLAGCLRRFELKRQIPYYATPESLIPLTKGNGWHYLLEQAGQHESGQQEQQMEAVLSFPDLPAPFDRIAIRGKSDHVDPPFITDYKTTGYVGSTFAGRAEHRAQANVYAWLWSRQRMCTDCGALMAADTECVLCGWGGPFRAVAPVTHYRIFYIGDNKGTADLQGELKSPEVTEDWIRRRIYEWAEPVSRGALPNPVQDLFNDDPKAKTQCSWCEMREACLSALDEGR